MKEQILNILLRLTILLFSLVLCYPFSTYTKDRKELDVKGVLIHITHYDPIWIPMKEFEKPFSLDVAIEVVDKMVEYGLNTLIVDIADGVIYESHPELKRHYSVPMEDLRRLAEYAHDKDIDFVPKLNFSKSGRNQHDMWMRPYWHNIGWTRNLDEYWKVAGDLINELVEVCEPDNFFHIGMDEDHYRSLNQYVEAVKILNEKISKYGLKPVMWNDTCYENRDVIAEVYADKMRAAEPLIPKDMVQLLWDYDLVHTGIVKRLSEAGFNVWVAPGRNKDRVLEWKKITLDEGGSGLIITNWRKCDEEHKEQTLNLIEELAPLFN